jgi:heat shock protein HtpX
MGEAFGLRTHIWSNNSRSMFLMLAFPLLALTVVFGLALLVVGAGLVDGGPGSSGELVPYLNTANIGTVVDATLGEGDASDMQFSMGGNAFALAWSLTLGALPYVLVGFAGWSAIAWVGHQGMIDMMIGGASDLDRARHGRVHDLLENLCISRGMRTPKLKVSPDPGLNAFATGLHEGQYCITLTQGLIDTLDEQALEAVIAHELTHIRNRDVRLMIVASIFVGVIALVCELVFRGLSNVRISGGDSGGGDRRGGSSGGAALVILALVILALAWVFAQLIRLALSRRREYLADAGAVELTKNPDAMVRALQIISGNPAFQKVPSEVREMCIENPSDRRDLLSTHPSIDNRIDALVRFGGARLPEPATEQERSPWG